MFERKHTVAIATADRPGRDPGVHRPGGDGLLYEGKRADSRSLPNGRPGQQHGSRTNDCMPANYNRTGVHAAKLVGHERSSHGRSSKIVARREQCGPVGDVDMVADLDRACPGDGDASGKMHAIDATKIHHELGWKPAESFETGIRKTIQWYLDNQDWVRNVTSGEYKNWIEKNYS